MLDKFLILIAQGAISAYQTFSRGLFTPSCRFTPSCSEYTRWAIGAFGLRRGLAMGLERLSHCHPFGKFLRVERQK